MATIKVSFDVKSEIDRYKQFMLEHEYSLLTALGYSTYLSRFLRWTETKTMFCFPEERINNFLDSENESNFKTYKNCRAALYLYFKMSEGKRFPKRRQEKCNSEIETILKQFYDYSVNIKRIRESSAIQEVSIVRAFLKSAMDSANFSLETITAYDIREYVVNHLGHLNDSSKGRLVTAIRNYFRFVKFNGIPVHESIFKLPLSPAVWKNAALPTTIDEDVFSRLHEIPDCSTSIGKRDRCIILCFTELALRCVEVASLTLDDFDWRECCVSIRNTKNHLDRKLPISDKFVNSIVEYLKTARPETRCRTLFVRFKHTCGEPMGCCQIRRIVRSAYQKTGTSIKSTGTHILRRTAATKIYNAGNSLKMTADILGHVSLDSTTRYTKADMIGLRQVAAPWPNVVGKQVIHDAK